MQSPCQPLLKRVSGVGPLLTTFHTGQWLLAAASLLERLGLAYYSKCVVISAEQYSVCVAFASQVFSVKHITPQWYLLCYNPCTMYLIPWPDFPSSHPHQSLPTPTHLYHSLPAMCAIMHPLFAAMNCTCTPNGAHGNAHRCSHESVVWCTWGPWRPGLEVASAM